MTNVQWTDSLMNAMMFTYQTRLCPAFKQSNCHHIPAVCFDSHASVQRRRPSYDRGRQQWNYVAEKCTKGYPNMPLNCKQRHRCRKYHSSDELRYHPEIYKTRPCSDSSFRKTGICSRGVQCWNYHNDEDKRYTNSQWIIPDASSPPPKQYIDWMQTKVQNQNVHKTNIQRRGPPPSQCGEPLCSQCGKYRQIIVGQQAEIKRLQEQLSQLRKANQVNVISFDEKSKSEKQINQSEMTSRLTLTLNSVDPANYHKWTNQDILIWIQQLDDRFSKYGEHLGERLKEEAIDGLYLGQVTEMDVTRWGIAEFEDKKFLLKKIQQLIWMNE